MNYIILCRPSPAALALAVQQAINDGFLPLGGVAYSYINAPLYMQAMGKEEK